MTDPNPNLPTAAYRHQAGDYALSQPGRRNSYNVNDQHGRKWLVSVELTRAGPALVGQVIPCFDDPLGTPQKYITMPRGRMDIIRIDFETWAADQEVAVREWGDQRDSIGRDLYDDRYDPDVPIDQLPGKGKELMRVIGKPPRGPDDIRAAGNGDKQFLKGAQPVRKRGGASRRGPRVGPETPLPKHDL